MRIAPPALTGRLGKGLDNVYLLFGTEPLLIEESADAIRAAARQHGVEEILRYTAGVDLDWQQISSASRSLSLFAVPGYWKFACLVASPVTRGRARSTTFLPTTTPVRIWY